jgi:hypothetical protein
VTDERSSACTSDVAEGPVWKVGRPKPAASGRRRRRRANTKTSGVMYRLPESERPLPTRCRHLNRPTTWRESSPQIHEAQWSKPNDCAPVGRRAAGRRATRKRWWTDAAVVSVPTSLPSRTGAPAPDFASPRIKSEGHPGYVGARLRGLDGAQRLLTHQSPGATSPAHRMPQRLAQVAELVDAQVSGTCGRKVVEVRVFSWAPAEIWRT